MGTRHVFNDTAAAIFVGGKMIPAGDGRDVDDAGLPEQEGGATDLPPSELSEEELALQQREANLREVLAGNSKSVIATLDGSSDETLAELARLEGEASQPRKGVLAAITEQQLKRAQERAGGAPT